MAEPAPGRPFVRTRPVMGTVASVRILDLVPDALLEQAAERVFASLAADEARFSTFRPDSEISRIDRGELHLLDAHPDVLEVLDACTWLEHESDGAFRARRPDGRLDPAGFVKGWAAERASRRLDEAGLRAWYVGVGGDLQVRGPKPDGLPWAIAVADPHHPGGILAVVDLLDGAVATSGTAERGGHVWDGRDGSVAASFVSVTVTGPSLTWADAYATTALALGEAGPGWVAAREGYGVLAVRADGATVAAGSLLDQRNGQSGPPRG